MQFVTTYVPQTCKLTPLYEVFRDHIDKAYASGGTNLYGAINKVAARSCIE
jgi:hypothetical protein